MAGGSSKSSTQQSTNTQDNRSVITETNTNYDLSNRSTSNLYDASTSNSNNTTTTTTNNTTTDFGAVSGALGLAGSAVTAAQALNLRGYDYADGIFSTALDFANQNDARMVGVFDKASSLTGSALGQLQNAYADAKGTSDSFKQIMFAVLAVAAVGFVMMRR